MPNEKLALLLSVAAAVGCTSPEEKILSELSRRSEQARAEMKILLEDLESGKCKAVFDRGDLFDPRFMSGRLEDGFDVPYNLYCEENGDYPLAAIVRYDDTEENQTDGVEFQGTYVKPDKSLGVAVYGTEKGNEMDIYNFNASQDGTNVIDCIRPVGASAGSPLLCKQFPFQKKDQVQLQASISQQNLRALAKEHRDLTKRLILKASKVAPNPPHRIIIRRGKDGKPESARKKF